MARTGSPACCSTAAAGAMPATCWPTAPGRAWLIPSWRPWRPGWPSATSRRCAISSPTWRRAASGPIRPKLAHADGPRRRRRSGAAWRQRLPLIAGGKSFGGRMTSQAQALEPLPGVAGLAFLGFPLHPAGQAVRRARQRICFDVKIPMLFLQGTRDALAELQLLLRTSGRAPRQARHAAAVRRCRSFLPCAGPHRSQGRGGQERDARRACGVGREVTAGSRRVHPALASPRLMLHAAQRDRRLRRRRLLGRAVRAREALPGGKRLVRSGRGSVSSSARLKWASA